MKYRDMRAQFIEMKIDGLSLEGAKILLLKLAKLQPEKFLKLSSGQGMPLYNLRSEVCSILDEQNSVTGISTLIKAIKYVREKTGTGLKDAKDYVENIRDHR